MSQPLQPPPRRPGRPRPQPGSALLGLALEGSRVEGVSLRRTNGSAEVRASFSAPLSLDLLTNDPELVGRELRNHLDAAGVRERRCVVGLPLSWVLTLSTKLPDLPEPDQESLLQIEAERGFPYAPDALMLARSRFRTPAGETWVTQVAVPREHLKRLEAVLAAAQLKPVSFSLGIAALQPPGAGPEVVLALAPGDSSVSLLISGGGGLMALRTVEGAFEPEAGASRFQTEHVLRELRITLGQLPPDVREALRCLRVFGRSEAAEEIAEQLASRATALGMRVEHIQTWPAHDAALRLPPQTPISPALSLAVGGLTGQTCGLELLPPRLSPWQQFAARYSSRRLVWAGGAATAVAGLIALAFLLQQWQLARWQSKWTAMKKQVNELETVQQQIKRFRPWFDESCRSLSILRRLTEAFPDDGSVTAKTVEIRDPGTVACAGTARDQQALLRTLDKLRQMKEIGSIQVEQMRGASPMQFTFNFRWTERAVP